MKYFQLNPTRGNANSTGQNRFFFSAKSKHFIIVFFLLMNFSFQVIAQDHQVTGRILDQDGKELSGSSVSVKNTNIATLTDSSGNFSIRVPNSSSVLVVTFVGFTTQEVPVTDKSIIDVTMVRDGSALQDVVVVGYGVQTKKSLTGAVATVKEEQLRVSPVGDPASRLQGRVAGVTVTNNNAPGATSSVRVRGYGSLGNNNPLYIIDGIPRTTMDNINSNDIESMTVLKDASSSAIYGSRAANGVIVITTKHGTSGAPVLSFDVRTGFQQKTNRPDLMNSAEAGENLWQKFKNMGLRQGDPGWGTAQYGYGATPVVPDYILPAGGMVGQVDESTYSWPNPYNAITKTNKGDIDWYEQIFSRAPVQEYNINISGGTAGKNNYSLSAGYLDQKGILNYGGDDINGRTSNGYKRYSLRSNGDVKVNKWLKAGISMGATFNNFTGTNGTGPINTTLTLSPLIPIYDIRGNFAGSKSPVTGNGRNAVADLVRNNNDYTRGLLLQASSYVQISLMKDLVFKSLFGFSYDANSSLDRNLMDPEFNQTQLVSTLSTTATNARQYNWANTLNYTKLIHDDHRVSVLVGMEAVDNYSEFVTGGRSTYAFTDPNYMVLSSGQKDVTNSGTFDQSRLFSYFGRINYDYQGKYLFEGTLRQDASSRFINQYQSGTFPAFSVGWRISQEDFMQDVSWINDLKLRVGWGKNGNDNVGNYNAYTTYIANGSESYYNISGSSRSSSVAGIHQSTLGNPNARWETSVANNLGLDLVLFDSKFETSLDVYTRSTTDMLYNDQKPATWGEVNLPNVNIGEMQNKGFDLNLTYRGKVGKDFNFSVNANISHFRNEVVKLNGNPSEIRYGNATEASFNTATVTGQPLDAFYGYVVEGIFNTQEEVNKWPKYNPNVAGVDVYSMPGVFKFQDVNGDGKITPLDRTFIGDGYPDYTYGFNIDLSYKNWDLNIFLQGLQGRKIINSVSRNMLFIRNDGNYLRKRLYESWTPERYASGSKITVPITINSDANMQLPSTFFVEDGDYARLKNLQLGYNFSPTLLSKIKVTNLRVYVQAINLFTITKYSGLDPEVAEQGVDNSVYPTSQIFMLGVNLKF
ncbi:SusC/RagA family TonB-linked outer membrane protein [Flavitalea sp.]|nr:TonB-dependent receptor [Flavitalea sp.]